MAYAYVGARALPTKPAAQWVDVDLSNTIVSKIYQEYQQIILTLSLDGEEHYVDMAQLKARYATYNNKLSVLLLSLGSETLDYLTVRPGGRMDYIAYTDVKRVGYHTMRTKAGVVTPENYPVADLVDLELTRGSYSTDLSLIHTHGLASVNGFYHQTDTDGTRAFVLQGGNSVQTKNFGHVGVIDFTRIGRLQKPVIDMTTVVSVNPDALLYDGLKFTVEEDLTDKSYFLILGGYMVLPQDGVFWQCGDQDFQLNLFKLHYLERVLESREFIDLTPLELTVSELNKDNINIEELTSDAVVKRYLSLSQSFMVIVDRKNLFWNKRYLRQAMMPGLFTSYQEPIYPLFVGYGRSAEYWKVHEDGYWGVTVEDSWFRNYIFDRQSKDTLVNVTSQLAMDRPYFHSQGFLLEIGAPASVSV